MTCAVGDGCDTSPVSTTKAFDATETLGRLLSVAGRHERVTHVEVLPARAGESVPWPGWADPRIVTAYRERGVVSPWRHQAEAAEAAHAGDHVVLSTGTASGKSLGYLLPGLSEVLLRRRGGGRRGATVLYLSPTKALAQDQRGAIDALDLPGLRAVTHDGDSGRDERAWARDHAEYLLTNPDMLHHSLLPGHERWHEFFALLRYVVVDECHHYRGVFGAHVAQVLRRLRRVCAAHGSSPTFVLASATIAEPETSARRLTGLAVRAITGDASPRGETTVVLWQPPFTSQVGENGAPVRRSTSAELADLVCDLVLDHVRTLAFVRSRRGTEVVAQTSRRLLGEVAPELSSRVSSYRGGYLPEDRRELEGALRRGDLLAVAATNALELGIDVAGLDAVLLGGFPGTRTALWQQVGRAGRTHGEALAVLVARDDPLDTYLVTHPESLMGAAVEASVFDPDNPHVVGPHLCAAAAEVPLVEADLPLFGASAREGVEALCAAGLLRRRPRGWFWTDRGRASDLADLRSSGGAPVRLVEATTGRLVGTVDAGAAPHTVHAGAVYLHQGATFEVISLDLADSVAVLEPATPAHYTVAREVSDIAVLAEREHRVWCGDRGEARISLGDVAVSQQVVSFQRRRTPGGELIGTEELDLPEQRLVTTAVWWTLPEEALSAAGLDEAVLPGSAHAAEHAAIGLLPLFASCDRWDIGGVSTARHRDTGRLTVFVYDGHPGGAGFSARGYAQLRPWLRATRDAVAACSCPAGCPSCVQSPKCGNANNPLDKAGAVRLLDVLLAASEQPVGSAPSPTVG